MCTLRVSQSTGKRRLVGGGQVVCAADQYNKGAAALDVLAHGLNNQHHDHIVGL